MAERSDRKDTSEAPDQEVLNPNNRSDSGLLRILRRVQDSIGERARVLAVEGNSKEPEIHPEILASLVSLDWEWIVVNDLRTPALAFLKLLGKTRLRVEQDKQVHGIRVHRPRSDLRLSMVSPDYIQILAKYLSRFRGEKHGVCFFDKDNTEIARFQ